MEQSMVVPKRPREEESLENKDDDAHASKRHKPFNHILSLLEESSEEDDDYSSTTTQDLSPLITSLQQEIFTDSDTLLSQHNPTTTTKNNNDNFLLEDCSSSTTTATTTTTTQCSSDDNELGRVMRHLLEASDDELGIPNGISLIGHDHDEDHGLLINGDGDMFSSICDDLWELQDEAANYNHLLHSQLFLY